MRAETVKRAHLDERELDRLCRGELGRAERRRFLVHLLKGCPVCTSLARQIWHMGEHAGLGRVGG